jgi:undecaprenyl-diphosphatase
VSSLDTKWFYAIYGLAHHSHLWDGLFFALNKISLVVYTGILLYYFFKNRKIFWIAGLSALLARGVFAEVIHYSYHRLRPFVVLPNVHQLVAQSAAESAFPSGHASYMFAIAFAVYLFDKKFGVILILGALLEGFIRVYAGVHYPVDIVGGIAVAWFSVFLVRLAWTRKKQTS